MFWETFVLLLIHFQTAQLSPVKLVDVVKSIDVELSCGYKSCHAVDPNRITVHLVPHSHDDVGWVKTVDQYYQDSVRHIISTTVEALKQNPDRRFIQVETAYFWIWWKEQNNDTRQDFLNLVNNGQLEIVNGAWSMNDEATLNYQSIIDQYTWGFRILSDKLGKCARPKVGWQIDPFGHSREHGSILSQLGFDGVFLGRLDYRDKENRRKEKSLDFIWQTSANLANSNLFSSIFPEFYLSPAGYCWDIFCRDERINDVIGDSGYNLDSKVEQFSDKMMKYSEQYRTKNILVPMGGDFQYVMASANFEGMDSLVQGFKDHQTVQVIYSTPSCYIKAVNEEAVQKSIVFPKKYDDFFPYASNEHSYWTGYFTSRPNLKRFERLANNILQAAKHVFAFSKLKGQNLSKYLTPLREAMGVMQHHDAVTGTEKRAVMQSYVSQLHAAIKQIDEQVTGALRNLLNRNSSNIMNFRFSSCLLCNVSICEEMESGRFVVAVYNPLTRSVTYNARLPVGDGTYQVLGPDGKDVVNELYDSISSFSYIPNANIHKKEMVFTGTIRPMGLNYYYIDRISNDNIQETVYTGKHDYNEIISFGTDDIGFTINGTTNRLKSVNMNGREIEIDQEFLYYQSMTDYDGHKPSGAYMFRPRTNSTATKISNNNITLTYQQGSLVHEVKQVVSDVITQIIRVYKNGTENYIEFDWLIGPIDPSTEIITRFTIKNFVNNGLFYTDSNGREMIRRELNTRSDYTYDPLLEPIASNYYPVTSKIVVKDENQELQVAILTDRAQGGTSLADGVVELMVHRRLRRDDGYGVDEPLNEEEFGQGMVVRGHHYLILGSTAQLDMEGETSIDAKERDLSLKKMLAPWVLVAKVTSEDQELDTMGFEDFSGSKSLPENVNILTFEPWINHTYILRLEHIFEKNEDINLSKAVTVDLRNISTAFKITDIKEVTLGANQLLDEFDTETKFSWECADPNKEQLITEQTTSNNEDPLLITLTSMQIRTFIITTDKVYNSDFDYEYSDQNVNKIFYPDNDGNGASNLVETTRFLMVYLLSSCTIVITALYS